jgi:hypothetical protein
MTFHAHIFFMTSTAILNFQECFTAWSTHYTTFITVVHHFILLFILGTLVYDL